MNGRIERPSGGTKNNFSVALFAKSPYRNPTEFEILHLAKQGDSPVAITDSTGTFYIVASAELKPDSIVVGVISAERPIVFGQVVAVNRLQAVPNTSTYDVYDDDPSGCNGCKSSPRKQTITTHYSYSLQDQILVIPY